ncbi:2-methoxy-6-polyprenyl-1,4-benzoquinol methylase, mitochondrial [Austwickia sp. TVS 96-490-7B]|uniref:class I SAM-dependent methyltransferase n=1 Tax=Austwickia sp. TVS 96-490-7B TaxID=2830843 RepID=UPI001C55DA91|nr:class I SAM-dependent methyltransferase [Austwickia sp. TVS 96-490-7B]MBW3086220.1 2-methoxy-6-polyprenyl-1,4-benzoquinol methylase, mitochondrial [Austwickia sp. TVS 96-490-7B]
MNTSPPDDAHAGYRPTDQRSSIDANRHWWDEDAQDYYAAHGAFLGDVDLVWGPEGTRERDAQLLGSIDSLVGRDVLEIGCGAGQGARWVAAQGARVVAGDLSAGMLRQARRIEERLHQDAASYSVAPESPQHERTPVTYVQADACALPFVDQSFDMAFSAYGAVPFVADSAQLMAEVYRVLRPGGRWVFSVTHPIRWAFPDAPGPAGLTVHRSYFDETPYVESLGDTITYAEHHRTLAHRINEVISAGLILTSITEPTWPADNQQIWGGWSPLRGALLPGTLIVSACRP